MINAILQKQQSCRRVPHREIQNPVIALRSQWRIRGTNHSICKLHLIFAAQIERSPGLARESALDTDLGDVARFAVSRFQPRVRRAIPGLPGRKK
jgi:hypothetical protein